MSDTENLMESMAKAVENALGVIICVSYSYKNSTNCRAGNFISDIYWNAVHMHRFYIHVVLLKILKLKDYLFRQCYLELNCILYPRHSL